MYVLTFLRGSTRIPHNFILLISLHLCFPIITSTFAPGYHLANLSISFIKNSINVATLRPQIGFLEMSNLQISRNSVVAAQQLAAQRENINANPSLTPEAKEWQIRYLERAFADARYGQTLSWPARIAWAIGTLPASFAWALCNFPDILRYGVLGGNGGLLEVEGGGHVDRLQIEGNSNERQD